MFKILVLVPVSGIAFKSSPVRPVYLEDSANESSDIALNPVPVISPPVVQLSDATIKNALYSSSDGVVELEKLPFVHRFESAHILPPLRGAAEKAKRFETSIKEHGFSDPRNGNPLLQLDDENGVASLALGKKAMSEIGSYLSREEKEPSASFLQLGTAEYKEAAEAMKRARTAEAAWEESKKKTDSLLSKVHSELSSLNQIDGIPSSGDRTELSMIEQSRKAEDEKLAAIEGKVRELAKQNIDLSPLSLLQTGENSMDDILAPLRQAGEQASHFAEDMRKKIQEKLPISLLQSQSAGDQAARALSIAAKALNKVDQEIAMKKDQLLGEEQTMRNAGAFETPEASVLQTGRRSDSGIETSLIQTTARGPAEAALARAEADLHKLKQQLREETAKLSAMPINV
jgi:hypothetical protein